jgi:hypothetical protein
MGARRGGAKVRIMHNKRGVESQMGRWADGQQAISCSCMIFEKFL